MRILVVEDDPGTRLLIEGILSRELAAEVHTAGRVDRALQLLDHELFDVVLLDHLLPDGTGLEVLAGSQRRGPLPVVIFLTGQGDEVVARRALSEGAVDYRVKGLDTYERLPSIVEQALTAWGPIDELVTGRPIAPGGAPELDPAVFVDLLSRTRLTGLVVRDGDGRVLVSVLPDEPDPEALGDGLQRWGDQAARLAGSEDGTDVRTLGVSQGRSRTAASLAVPGRFYLAGLFDGTVEPQRALSVVRAVARLLPEAAQEP